jgi:hypothetical protein
MQVYSIRTLNNVAATGAGLAMSTVLTSLAEDLVEGGLIGAKTWCVIVKDPGSPVLSYQVEVKITDGTWQKIPSSVTASPTVGAVLSFTGPFVDMRGNVTAYTSGNLTMDIFVAVE